MVGELFLRDQQACPALGAVGADGARVKDKTSSKCYFRSVKPNENQSSQPADEKSAITKSIVFCRSVNAVLMALFAVVGFLSPAAIVIHDLTDSHIRTGGIPHAAWKLHRALSPKYAKWARQRVASDRGLELSTSNISGTEWPLFGSVFYLWATETLQDDWDTNQPAFVAPKVYAKEAIEAATELVID